MAKKKHAQAPSRDYLIEALAATLPDDEPSMLEAARLAVDAFHDAVMQNNPAEAELASQRVGAVVFKLNGGTFFGSSADEESAGAVVERHCAAKPGIVPKWGQKGEFLVEVAGLRGVVEFGDGFGWDRFHMAFHADDMHQPFISETGYRSYFGKLAYGMTVDEAARKTFAQLLADGGRRMVAPQYRKTNARTWTGRADADAVTTFEDEQGQGCFAF